VEGWINKTVGEICKLRNGRAYKKSELLSSGKYPVLRVGNFFTNDHWYYSDLELDETKYCDNDALLYAWSASFGPQIWTGSKVIFHYHIWRVDFDETQILKKFLYYWLSWDAERIKNDQGTGTTMLHVSMKSMNTRKISFPSLLEQERIVSILDESFAAIDTAIANTEKNLVNAQELFEVHLNAIVSQPADDWVRKPLAVLCDPNRIITYGVIKLGKEVSDGVPCLRTSNVRWLHIETDDMKRISQSLSAQYSRTILTGGEVLVNVRGTLGGVVVVGQDMAGWNVSREVAVVPVDPNLVKPEFISYIIASSTSQEWLSGVKKGAAYIGINLEDLRKLPVNVPDLGKQLEIVQQLSLLQKESERLKFVSQRKLEALTELKQSILHQAFTGQLTNTPTEALKAAGL